MSLEQHLRDQLDRATRDVVGGPDLATAVTDGRTGRRRRHLVRGGVAVAALAVGGVLAASVLPLGSDGSTPTAADPTSAASSSSSVDGGFVEGTDIDEMLERIVERHVPTLDRPDEVYPSDWESRGPMPDADHADATDWQATYTASTDEQLLVFMGYPPPDEPTSSGCEGVRRSSGQPDCSSTRLPNGGSVTDDAYTTEGSYVFYTVYVSPSGFTVDALETVTASSWQQAADRRQLDYQILGELVTDPKLTFPAPSRVSGGRSR